MLEMPLRIGAKIVNLQQPFIWNKSITHSAFNFYWSRGLKNKTQVLTTVKKELRDKIIVDNRTDLIDHPYLLTLDILDVDNWTNKPVRPTQVINGYDNHVG